MGISKSSSAAASALQALVLAACSDDPAPPSRAEIDRAVAMVERAQDAHAPVRPVLPEPITPADVRRRGLGTSGCAFLSEHRMDDQPVFLAGGQRGFLKIDGQFVVLAADNGSTPMATRSFDHYVGRAQTVRIVREGQGVPVGGGQSRWLATLTLRDKHDRVVYGARGVLECAP